MAVEAGDHGRDEDETLEIERWVGQMHEGI
jgi:hypothetical protein